MHLAIDIGNSALKFALFEDDRMTVQGIGIEDLADILTQAGALPVRAIMASVADSTIAADLLRKFNIPLTLLSPSTPLPIGNLYETPATLGSDRIAIAVAAARLYDGGPVLAIGAGTCITYNFINAGNFIGGAISPGITMRFQAMGHYTSRLPVIDWEPYRQELYTGLTGANTERSIISGVLNGTIQEITGTIEQYRQRYSGLHVAITGGDMPFLVKNLKNDIFARPDMVLEGLNYILLHHA